MRRRLVALLVVHLTSIVSKELASSLLRERLALVLVISASVVVHQQRAGLSLGVSKSVRVNKRALTWVNISVRTSVFLVIIMSLSYQDLILTGILPGHLLLKQS